MDEVAVAGDEGGERGIAAGIREALEQGGDVVVWHFEVKRCCGRGSDRKFARGGGIPVKRVNGLRGKWSNGGGSCRVGRAVEFLSPHSPADETKSDSADAGVCRHPVCRSGGRCGRAIAVAQVSGGGGGAGGSAVGGEGGWGGGVFEGVEPASGGEVGRGGGGGWAGAWGFGVGDEGAVSDGGGAYEGEAAQGGGGDLCGGGGGGV